MMADRMGLAQWWSWWRLRDKWGVDLTLRQMLWLTIPARLRRLWYGGDHGPEGAIPPGWVAPSVYAGMVEHNERLQRERREPVTRARIVVPETVYQKHLEHWAAQGATWAGDPLRAYVQRFVTPKRESSWGGWFVDGQHVFEFEIVERGA
jgi:hypothetical protein